MDIKISFVILIIILLKINNPNIKMGNLDNLYLHSMVHPDVVAAYVNGKKLPEAIFQEEVPDTSVQAYMNTSRPIWDLVSKELSSVECLKDLDGNTGVALKTYILTYEDINPKSKTYGETKIVEDINEVEDLEACPISPVHDPVTVLKFVNKIDSINPVRLKRYASTTGPKDLGLEYNIENRGWIAAESDGAGGYKFNIGPKETVEVRCQVSSESGKWSYGSTNYWTFMISDLEVYGNPQAMVYKLDPGQSYPDSIPERCFCNMFTANNCNFELEITASSIGTEAISRIINKESTGHIILGIRFDNDVTFNKDGLKWVLSTSNIADIHFVKSINITHNKLFLTAKKDSSCVFRVDGDIFIGGLIVNDNSVDCFSDSFNLAAHAELRLSGDTKNYLESFKANNPQRFTEIFGANTYIG